MTNNVFTEYEIGLKRLKDQLGSNHLHYANALIFQQRLQENIYQTRIYGDTEARRAERAQIIDALNRLTLETLDTSFNDLCRMQDISQLGIESKKKEVEQFEYNLKRLRYLSALKAELEKREGVLEYVSLSCEIKVTNSYGVQKVLDPAFAPFTTKKPILVEALAPDVTKCYDSYFLLGEPGYGKTTTLRKIVFDIVNECILENSHMPIPYWLELSSWHNDQSLEDFLEQHWGLGDNLHQEFTQGSVFLFLDGLNEIAYDSKEKIQSLKKFLTNRTSRPKRMIISCRTDDYYELGFDKCDLDIPIVFIKPLNTEKIREFTQKYLGDNATFLLSQILPVDEEISNNNSIDYIKLAQNPFMLRALILIYQEKLNEELPQISGKLLKELARILWYREKTRNAQGWIDYEAVLPSLSKLAYSMFNNRKSTSVPLSYAKQFMEVKKIRLAKQASILQISDNQVEFYHQLIQEYFAAEYVVSDTGIIESIDTNIAGVINAIKQTDVLRTEDTILPVAATLMGTEIDESVLHYWKQISLAMGTRWNDELARLFDWARNEALHSKVSTDLTFSRMNYLLYRLVSSKHPGANFHRSFDPAYAQTVTYSYTDTLRVAERLISKLSPDIKISSFSKPDQGFRFDLSDVGTLKDYFKLVSRLFDYINSLSVNEKIRVEKLLTITKFEPKSPFWIQEMPIYTVRDLIHVCKESPNVCIPYFKKGDFENWFRYLNLTDLADDTRKIRESSLTDAKALKKFIETCEAHKI